MVGEKWKKGGGRRRSAIRYFKSVEDTSSIGVKETRKVPFSETKGAEVCARKPNGEYFDFCSEVAEIQ
ncbi:hypothetical protein D5086_030540 [Populus alba]|uniref:Uncharacterized protein n=1 Tax=Populus alba TaxID=43335 RepID=A0ACC4APF4_POPAL